MAEQEKDRVVLAGLDVPFWDLVWFMVKFAFASIPAIFIIYFIVVLIGMIFAGLGSLGLPNPGL
ncbi:hypothetical protein [Nitratifractor sp.]|uniref:hypothetical protein n=1 Tax=Nitratifractor sp. TaxID=2268144 RepID=UPI0025D7B8B0|nr:hypothetical protein [Nitratifractor sp.]